MTCTIQGGYSYDAICHKFTGKERDAESNLDYFGARHYGSGFGRFLQPDEPFADQDTGDPQSWNMYFYVRNNPLSSVDFDGRMHQNCVDKGDQRTCTWVGDYNGEYDKQNNTHWNEQAQEWQGGKSSQQLLSEDAINRGFLGPADVFFIRIPDLGRAGPPFEN